jgi:hypothetical protein
VQWWRGAEDVRRKAELLAAVAEVFPLAVPEVVFVDPDVGALAYRKLPGMPLLGRDLDQPEWLGPPLGRAWRDRDRERAVFYARAALIEDLVYGWRTGTRAYVEAGQRHLERTFG